MKSLGKSLLFSLVGLGLVGASVTPAQACKRSYGGWGGGFYRSAPVYYHQPVYVAPPRVLSQPVPQPIQSLPVTAGINGQGNLIGQQPGLLPQGQTQPGLLPQQGQPGAAAQPAREDSTGTAQRTALQLLADFASESQATAPSAEADQGLGFNRVGIWTATLSNGAVVQLNLQADNSFVWLASVNGKQSTFQGTYTMDGESLTLTRSNDNQRLAGSMTITAENAFTFKLNGTQDAGLSFARQ